MMTITSLLLEFPTAELVEITQNPHCFNLNRLINVYDMINKREIMSGTRKLAMTTEVMDLGRELTSTDLLNHHNP